MLLNNNNFFPRTAGGYSLETYEPAVIRPDQRQRAEDLVRMAFTDRKPLATISNFPPAIPQVKIVPKPTVNNIQFAQVRKIQPIVYNNPTIRKVQIITPNQNQIYKFNNAINIKPVPTVKSMDSTIKPNNFLYQNLIIKNKGYRIANNNLPVPVNPGTRLLISNFNNQRVRPILRSNSANNYNASMFNRGLMQKRIITGPSYKLQVYKRNLL